MSHRGSRCGFRAAGVALGDATGARCHQDVPSAQEEEIARRRLRPGMDLIHKALRRLDLLNKFETKFASLNLFQVSSFISP